MTIIPYRFTFWFMQLPLTHFTEISLSTGHVSQWFCVLKLSLPLHFFFPPPFYCAMVFSLLWMTLFPEEALESYCRNLWPRSSAFGSQCITTSCFSALRTHVAAKLAFNIEPEEWVLLLFSSSLSPLQLFLAFCPSPHFKEKPAKKTKHLDSARSQ